VHRLLQEQRWRARAQVAPTESAQSLRWPMREAAALNVAAALATPAAAAAHDDDGPVVDVLLDEFGGFLLGSTCM